MNKNKAEKIVGVVAILIVVIAVGVGYIKLKEAGEWGEGREMVVKEAIYQKEAPKGNRSEIKKINEIRFNKKEENKNMPYDNPGSDDYCKVEPVIGTDAFQGILLYPTNPKYDQSGWMATVFTEDDCGRSKMGELFEVKEGVFWPGAKITLKSVASHEFLEVLKKIGFNKGEKCKDISEEKCGQWVLEESVSVGNILEIKPFVDEIKYTDCVNCG